MITTLLFGVQHSPQRKLCIALSIVIVVLGIAIIPVQGWQWGLPFVLIGILAGAILARVFAAHDLKVGTAEQLERVGNEYGGVALRDVVDHTAGADPNTELGRVTGRFDVDEIREAVDQVRGEEAV